MTKQQMDTITNVLAAILAINTLLTGIGVVPESVTTLVNGIGSALIGVFVQRRSKV